ERGADSAAYPPELLAVHHLVGDAGKNLVPVNPHRASIAAGASARAGEGVGGVPEGAEPTSRTPSSIAGCCCVRCGYGRRSGGHRIVDGPDLDRIGLVPAGS